MDREKVVVGTGYQTTESAEPWLDGEKTTSLQRRCRTSGQASLASQHQVFISPCPHPSGRIHPVKCYKYWELETLPILMPFSSGQGLYCLWTSTVVTDGSSQCRPVSCSIWPSANMCSDKQCWTLTNKRGGEDGGDIVAGNSGDTLPAILEILCCHVNFWDLT